MFAIYKWGRLGHLGLNEIGITFSWRHIHGVTQSLNSRTLPKQFSDISFPFSCGELQPCFKPNKRTGFLQIKTLRTREQAPFRQWRGFHCTKVKRLSQGIRFNATNPHEITSSLSKNSIVVKVKDLERYLRVRGYSTLKWGVGILATIGLAIYMFREPIKENLSDEVADVASRSLGDESVVLRANEISKAIVNQVLTDQATIQLASGFLTNLLQDDELVKKCAIFVRAVINDEQTQNTIKSLAEGTLQKLLEQENTRKLLLDYIRGILLDKYTKKACKELLDKLAEDKQTKQILADFFKSVLQSDTVKNEAVSLGKNVTKQIVTDKRIQDETGIALWMAVKRTLTPSWFFAPEVKQTPQDLAHKKFESGPF